jgi:hypothetical protein
MWDVDQMFKSMDVDQIFEGMDVDQIFESMYLVYFLCW